MSSPPALPRSAAIIGLGLIGGSLARDLLMRGVRVSGYDRDEATLRQAADTGIVPLPDISTPTLAEAELIVVALPVIAAVEAVPAIARATSPDGIVIDLGSTKRSVVRAAMDAGIGSRFVGSHPMAGDHRSGWKAARPGLFSGARVFLSPTDSTLEAVLERVRSFWLALGAHPEDLEARAHDRQVAWTSHLPQVVASALAGALATGEWRLDDLGPGGRDATRLAASSPEMWSAICSDNADLIEEALSAIQEQINSFRSALHHHDLEALQELFTAGQHWSATRPSGS
jgi:prephenate dehydrogenase